LKKACKEDGDEAPFNAEEEYDKIVEPKTKRRDVYILGSHKLSHRLLCGSLASEENFERLIEGKIGKRLPIILCKHT
jgi:hypothetical protein